MELASPIAMNSVQVQIIKDHLDILKVEIGDSSSSVKFVEWLRGFIEIGNPTEFSPVQVKIIGDKLDTLFDKITPDRKTSPLALDLDGIREASNWPHNGPGRGDRLC